MKEVILIGLTLFSNMLFSQSIGIGTTTPNASAILDISSTTKGLLIPRMTTAQRDAIVAPVQGLSIFNTDDSCTDTYSGQSWLKNCTMKNNGAYTLSANSWRPRADFGGTARRGAVGFSIGTKGYIGTGYDGQIQNGDELPKKDFWEYDPATNVWTQKADVGNNPRQEAVGFSIGMKGYIGTGRSWVSNLSDFWEYDPTTNIWIQKADFGGSVRRKAVGFSIGTKGYIGTGRTGFGSYYKDFWEYDPTTNIWTQKADFGGVSRFAAVGFSIGSKGYIGTGTDLANNYKDFWEFTPAGGGLGSWVQKADFGGIGRQYATGFSIGTYGYLGTSANEGDIWIYYSLNNIWSLLPDFCCGERSSAVGFSIGTKGYIGTGWGGFKKDFWEYNSEPTLGKEYTENIPVDATKYKGHDWTSEGNKLYTTLDNVDLSISGKSTFNGNAAFNYTNILEFGKGQTKEPNAGKIGYQIFSGDGLDIIGAGYTYPNRKIKLYDRLYFDNIIDSRKLVLWETANNAHQFYGLGIESGTLRYQIAGAGNVHRFYAGTSATSSKLLFTIYDSGDVTIERDAYAVANMFAQGFYPTSDKKLKKNLVRTTNSLTNIIKLNGYNYNWVDDNYPTLQTGLIAQEVQEIYPHLVVKNKDGNLAVNYNALVPELIEAIKELKEKNEALEKSLTDFKTQIQKEIDLLHSKNK